jgi:hypothetical protein
MAATDTPEFGPDTPLAALAEKVCAELESSGAFRLVDWNDLGELTVQVDGRTYRAAFADITDEAA